VAKRILNLHEEATHLRLREACEPNGAHVFAKVRLADVLPIEKSGIDDDLFRFALQSHFDFVVCDQQHDPLFAVEFDGPSHNDDRQRQRDERKDSLCHRFEFPLLRVNSRYLNRKYRDMDLLSWFVEIWFCRKWFEEAQASGQVPYDEPFMPQSFVSIPGRKNRFPLWLSAAVRGRIQQLCFAGKILDLVPSQIIGVDAKMNYHALAFLRVTPETGVMAETAMRSQNFPVSESEALDEIVTTELFEDLKEALQDPSKVTPANVIEQRIVEFSSSYKFRRMFHCGGSYVIPSHSEA
jgi:hypothetical protein